jgi:hypothetical protein
MLSSKKSTWSRKELYLKTTLKQFAIIEAISSEKNNRHEIVIITDFLRTMISAENRTPTKNPKTQSIRKMLDHEGPRVILLWVPSHVGIPGNEMTDQAAKEALDEYISTTVRYPSLNWRNGLPKRISRRETKDENMETTKWKKGSWTSAERRIRKEWQKNEGPPRPVKMEEVSNPLCYFCNTYLSIGHILWECRETEDQRMHMDMRKEQWINGKKGMEKIIDYAKEMGL